jgi:hypothetical protein
MVNGVTDGLRGVNGVKQGPWGIGVKKVKEWSRGIKGVLVPICLFDQSQSSEKVNFWTSPGTLHYNLDQSSLLPIPNCVWKYIFVSTTYFKLHLHFSL